MRAAGHEPPSGRLLRYFFAVRSIYILTCVGVDATLSWSFDKEARAVIELVGEAVLVAGAILGLDPVGRLKRQRVPRSAQLPDPG